MLRCKSTEHLSEQKARLLNEVGVQMNNYGWKGGNYNMYYCRSSHAGLVRGNGYYTVAEWMARLPGDAKVIMTVANRHGNGLYDHSQRQPLPRATAYEVREAISKGEEPWASVANELVRNARGLSCYLVWGNRINGMEMTADWRSLRLGLEGDIEIDR